MAANGLAVIDEDVVHGRSVRRWAGVHHLNALSNLYRRARAERAVPSGYDPVGDLLEKPAARRVEAKWLEVPDAALLLEAARTYRPPRGQRRPLPPSVTNSSRRSC